jgi:hypothetical protein
MLASADGLDVWNTTLSPTRRTSRIAIQLWYVDEENLASPGEIMITPESARVRMRQA